MEKDQTSQPFNQTLSNDRTINLKVFILQQGKNIRQETIQCLHEQKINDIKLFQEKKICLGGLVLDNNRTFGDYQVGHFGALFVYDPGYNPQSKDYIISEWREKSYNIKEVSNGLKQKWITQCLGLRGSEIIQLNQKQFFENLGSFPRHMLVAPRTNLQKLYYSQNIHPRYTDAQEDIYQNVFKPMILDDQEQKQRFMKVFKDRQNALPQKQTLLLYLFTTSSCFEDLNDFLRDIDKSKYKDEQMQEWYCLTNLLIKSLGKLPQHQSITAYYGDNFSLEYLLKDQKMVDRPKFVLFRNFTNSAFKKSIAKSSVDKNGTIFTIKTRSGKNISIYSNFQGEEVLIPAFTYFLITKFDLEARPQQVQLQEIPFPCTNSKKLVFWVDDKPLLNSGVVEYFEKEGIEVVQMMSTRTMRVLLTDYFGILQAMGKRIVVITNMCRFEDGVWLWEAGVDLLSLMSLNLGMTNKVIIFNKDKQRTEAAITKRGLAESNWVICAEKGEVIGEVEKEFAM